MPLAKHVMVVDDDQDTVTVVEKMLESRGYKVHSFSEPVSALTHAHYCNKCSLVVTDYLMPVMNGLQLVKALKKMQPEIRVVLMTAYRIRTMELSSSRVDQFLTKPFGLPKLLEAIEKSNPLLHQRSRKIGRIPIQAEAR